MPLNGSLKVLVVDDHLAIRIGIASLIDAERPNACAPCSPTWWCST